MLYGLNLQHRQLQLAQRQSLQPIAANPVKASDVGSGRKSAPAKSCCACTRFVATAANPAITAGTARHKRRCQLNSSARQGTLQLTLPEGVTPEDVGVQWNGQPLKADPAKPNTYSVPLWGAPEPRS